MRRVSIRTLMGVVVLAAIDCAAIRLHVESGRGPDLADLAIFGLLPMANILLAAATIFLRDPQGPRRPYLIGFLACGCIGWVLTAAAALVATRPIHDGIGDAFRPLQSFMPAFLLMASLTLLAPQLGVAMLGGRYARQRVVRSRLGSVA